MTEFEKLLKDVIQGKGNLSPVRAWLDKNLSRPDCDHAALVNSLDKALASGLSEPVARAIRTHIDSVAPAAAKPAKVAGPTDEDFPFELEPMLTVAEEAAKAAEKTQLDAKNRAEKTQLTNNKADPTAPATGRPAGVPTDRTVIQQPAGEDSNITMRTDKGRTVITRSTTDDPTTNRRSGGRSGPAQETDPFAMDSNPTSGRSGRSATGTSWRTSTGLKNTGGADNLGPGSVLKDRFELMDVLGEGGMGKVYKARDLLKVEAKDKNPYIAVKTLTGDFKQHPESFIALQRESSKAQRLAHPNIATVFDFDRDGGTVYMTMELMEGDELAKFIKHLPAGGLPVPDAMNIIKQLCDGLAYAHSKQLVHSDFKPGNAFLTKDGTVKLLDFGIARASKTRKDTSGETTVFDPGQLGALTPAYATVEMFEGMDPENVKELGWAVQGEEKLAPELEKEANKLLNRLDEDPASLLGEFELSEADRAVLQDQGIRERMRRSFREAVATGVWGWVDDDLACVNPWGFDVAEIRVPVEVRYGASDVLVPAGHGRWLARHVPNATVIVDQEAGHLSTPDEQLERLQALVDA